VVQALRGEKLTVYGEGSQTRCFCYVDDMINGLVASMRYEGPDAAEPINIGNSHEQSMMELIDCLSEILGRPLEVRHLPLPKDDPVRRRPDCTRAQERLAWEPTVSFKDGLTRTVEYFRRALEVAS
jgi:UDP-glucuronate decarboxylase